MGQGTSKANGNLTFGHLSTPPTTIEPEEDNNDLLLTKPELYGLDDKSISPISQNKSLAVDRLGRIDSAYCDNRDEKLINDLFYVDKTYYDNMKPKHQRRDITTNNNAPRLTFTDVALASLDKSMHDINLSFRYLGSLSPNVGLLTMIRKLDLSNNCLTRLPDAIGYLHHLEVLCLTHNAVTEIPDTLSYLPHLLELDLSHNHLGCVPPCIGYLKKLQTLQLCRNRLVNLPVEVVGMTNLSSLDVSQNPLQILPAEIIQLPFLRRLRIDETDASESAESTVHDPPSLVELCGRMIVRYGIPTKTLPSHLTNYLCLAKSCSSCYGPYFENYVVRQRLIDRGDQTLRLEYRLCSAHWTDDHDRMLSMFSEQPLSERVPIQRPCLLPLSPRHERKTTAVFARRPRHSLSSSAADYVSSSEDDESPSRLLSGWRLQRKKVMSKNHSGFLKLKRPIPKRFDDIP
ncbi:hypothetical protein DFQ28_011339 [Apophysomyces sp. BC1034]|nr:hypothetical protein DFQ30_003143 [Apophysomyces sp. BC1015]KAG0181200.1 hypothetical protein DFQ29_009071 [Apophysomyces sp. BC1021]KAG0191657.1 hypothetical protein DFQ28_011339 [Apophysomyces sp. BC1034]